MLTVVTTRFNNSTWTENKKWCKKRSFTGGIYNVPTAITASIPKNSYMFVVEMNNDRIITSYQNKFDNNTSIKGEIMGISLIKNRVVNDQEFNIYESKNYNRYTYVGKYRININELSDDKQGIVHLLAMLVFNGKGHLKRGSGITKLPEKYLDPTKIDFIGQIKEMFIERFPHLEERLNRAASNLQQIMT